MTAYLETLGPPLSSIIAAYLFGETPVMKTNSYYLLLLFVLVRASGRGWLASFTPSRCRLYIAANPVMSTAWYCAVVCFVSYRDVFVLCGLVHSHVRVWARLAGPVDPLSFPP